MQIDFHFGVTYIVARMAGFSPKESHTIAYSAQYVDDAVHEGMLTFQNRASYKFIASAHKMLDYRNFRELANKYVWIPFHFLPGNQIEDRYKDRVDNFLQKLVCRPNSLVAKDLLKLCVENRNQKFSLHLLGVVMHSYADTWAHQGFCGITSHLNIVGNIYDYTGVKDKEMHEYIDRYYKGKYVSWISSLFKKFSFEKLIDVLKSAFLNEINPIGHGSVLSYPDLPYIRWKYQNWNGDIIERNNPADFFEAVVNMLYAMKKFRGEELQNLDVYSQDLKLINQFLEDNNSNNSSIRLQAWLSKIRNGEFSFGSEGCDYLVEGEDSWLNKALGFKRPQDFQFDNLRFRHEFMESDWKSLHDAIAYQKFAVLNLILPKYGISVT